MTPEMRRAAGAIRVLEMLGTEPAQVLAEVSRPNRSVADRGGA